jgi:hypothetical protein
MKRLTVLLFVCLLPQICLGYGNGDVCITMNGGDNVVYTGGHTNTLEIRIANDAILSTISLGFSLEWNPSVTIDWDMSYGSDPPVNEEGRAIGAFDSFTGLLVSEDFDDTSPDHILISGVSFALPYGLPDGPSEICYALQFEATGPTETVVDGFCVDPYVYPPAGYWIFNDAEGIYPPDFCGVPTVDDVDPQAEPECFDVTEWQDLDTDDGVNEVGIAYIQDYRGSHCGGFRSPVAHVDALVFGYGMMYNGWTRNWFLGNHDVIEKFFNDWNEVGLFGVDNSDILYFSGEGYPGKIWFRGDWSEFPDCDLASDDIVQEWGDNDLEWVFFNSSKTMGTGDEWGQAFNGLHGIMGFSPRMAEHGSRFFCTGMPAILEELASLLHDNPVVGSFVQSVAFAYEPFGAFDIVVVLPEEIRTMEYAWGTGGEHMGDPPAGDEFFVWKYHYDFKEGGKSAGINLDNRISVSNGENGGPVISMLSDLAERASEPTDIMYRLMVQHRTVNEAYISDLADSFCSNYGFLCDRELHSDRERGTLEMVDGPHVLTVFEETGGWRYIQKGLRMVHGDYAPDLLQEHEVPPAAEEVFEHFGGLPSDTFHLGPIYLNSAMYTNDGVLIPDSCWDIEVSMGYTRNRNGMTVSGPGAGMRVDFGDSAKIIDLYHNGWREVIEGDSIQTVTAQQAIDNLAFSGWDVSLCGIPHHDELIIYDAVLGYYEPAVYTLVDELQPVWFLRTYCILDSDTSLHDIPVSAEYLSPIADIVTPSADTTIDWGDTLMFYANVFGEDPLEIAWYSDVDGLIDTGEVIWVDDLSVVHIGDDFGAHMITLEVTDGNGMPNYDIVFVTVLPTFLCGDADASGGVDIDDAVYLINYIFMGGPAPEPPEAGDCDCTSTIDIDDVVWLINYIFVAGNAPCDLDGDGIPDC